MAAEPGVPPAEEIDRSASTPYYLQLKAILHEQVTSGLLRPGDQLEGEHDLARRYGVSRPVVRQALAELHRENVLERIKGRGTFVAEPKTAQSLVQCVHGLYDDVAALGRTLRSEVRSFTVEPSDTDLSERLRVPVHSPVIALERLRLVDGEPWVYTISHVPFTLAPDLLKHDLTTLSLYHLLRELYGLEIERSDRRVEAQRSDAALAKDLHISKGDPVLKLTSLSFVADGTPIETFVAFHRADRSSFEVSLTRSEQGHPTRPVVRLL